MTKETKKGDKLVGFWEALELCQNPDVMRMLIHSKPLKTVTLFNKLLIPAGVQPRKVTAMQLTEATIEMVKAGLGVTVMARWAVRHYLESGQVAVVPVTQKGLHRTWYAIMLMDMDLPPYIHHFVDYLDQEIKL